MDPSNDVKTEKAKPAATSLVRRYHDMAMDLAMLADRFLKLKMNEGAFIRYYAAAKLEITAATSFAKEKPNEPTRSILFLSAASLAYCMGDFALARELIEEGCWEETFKWTKRDFATLLASLREPLSPEQAALAATEKARTLPKLKMPTPPKAKTNAAIETQNRHQGPRG